VLSFAGQDNVMLAVEMWRMLNTFDWMWLALAGFVLMVMAGVTSYKKARAKMSYETWWIIHIYTYVAIAASFMHQILNGQMFVNHPLNRFYWTTLYVLMAASIITYRFGIPIFKSLRHNLVVEKVVVEGPGIISVIMKGRKLHKLAAEGGQFFSWRFLTRGHALMSHPYSLSAAPTESHLRITVKDLGDHSRSVAYLKPGTRVFVEGPYGAFTAGRATMKHIVLIGGEQKQVNHILSPTEFSLYTPISADKTGVTVVKAGLSDVWNDRWLKQYATAKIKYQWGSNLSKFAGIQMPGGVTLDGPRIMQEALEEIHKIEEEMYTMSSLPSEIFVG
jgi:hypothetical protein